MLASIPASILNQSRTDLGIPNRFRLTSSRFNDAEQAARWARTALAAKNTLTGADARLVQLAFELRLSAVAGDTGRASVANELQTSLAGAMERRGSEPADAFLAASEAPSPPEDRVQRQSRRARRSDGIDKSVLSISEVRRYRDKAHMRFVASLPCLL
jgi:hypothetical protein